VECMRYGLDGKPTPGRDGYARFTHTYDDRDNQTEVALFTADGRPVRGRGGWARLQRTYDDHDNLTEIRFLGPDGKLVALAGGMARTTRSSARNRRQTGGATYDPSGRLVKNPGDGLARFSRTFDPGGRPLTMTCFGPDGKRIKCKEGWARQTF